jgi:N utilization substance protein B
MTRTQEREQAFIMIFEKAFNSDITLDELFSYAYETESFEKSLFCETLTKSVFENLDAIDSVIEKYSIGWKISRLPKVTLSILRLAFCEIMFVDSIPESVSANEAVELAKKYATDADASFINGIIGTYLREKNTNE